jgi:hypothetical protein
MHRTHSTIAAGIFIKWLRFTVAVQISRINNRSWRKIQGLSLTSAVEISMELTVGLRLTVAVEISMVSVSH